ncbi:hypothetical protein [Coleofasciculus sp.]|uniref:hypothetical protein n=1 Tax=Coleofasciculus sp. TaxID=3100458 RepID=UPI003A25BDDD
MKLIMNSLKKSIHLAMILAFALSFIMFCFPTVAMADTCTNPGNPVPNPTVPFDGRMIHVENGKFDVDTQVRCLNKPKVIRAAIVSLYPATATGSIDQIVITGPNGKREFGCTPRKVVQGTDLIAACGGPAVLEAGDVRYQAQGSGFGEEPVKLGITFSSEFKQ